MGVNTGIFNNGGRKNCLKLNLAVTICLFQKHFEMFGNIYPT